MFLFFSGIVLGGIISWIISHFYYRKSSDDNIKSYNKLSLEIQDVVVKTNKNNISISDLNELLDHKCLDPESASYVPYKCCPKCGSLNISKKNGSESVADEEGAPYEEILCRDCGWNEVGFEQYTLNSNS